MLLLLVGISILVRIYLVANVATITTTTTIV